MLGIRRLALVLSLLAPVTVCAHHSVALNFSDEVVTLEGTVTSLKWVNPHASFILKVTDEKGVTEEWLVELQARIALQRKGFDFDALQEGTTIRLTGRLGRQDKRILFGEAVLPDGRILLR